VSDAYRHCSSCKKPIPFESTYFACSVSTCNRKRIGLYFCSVPCWDAHLPEARHREAWAEEKRAPTREQAAREDFSSSSSGSSSSSSSGEAAAHATPSPAAPRRVVVAPPAPVVVAAGTVPDGDLPKDILIVVSKLKAYVRAASGMNTSDGVFDALSDHVRRISDAAARVAAQDGRKTIMDRDFATVLADWTD
jgi:hypothetical protein